MSRIVRSRTFALVVTAAAVATMAWGCTPSRDGQTTGTQPATVATTSATAEAAPDRPSPDPTATPNLRPVQRLKVGETGWITPAFVRDTDKGLVVLMAAKVNPQQLGGSKYDFTAMVIRTVNGLTVCMPAGDRPVRDRHAQGLKATVGDATVCPGE